MEQYQLSITRVIDAPVEKVFNAWADQETAKKWMSPESHTVANVEIDPKQGGKFMLSMQSKKTGKLDSANSTIKEIIPNKKLVLAWQWEAYTDDVTTLTLDFKPVSTSQTELTLTHTELKSEKSKTDHTQGWESCLNNLQKLFINN